MVFLLVVSLGFVYGAYLNYKSFMSEDYTTVKWQTIDEAQKNYNIFNNAFNAQKQAVVDAYNKQVDEIHKNGLKTEADFAGLKFNHNIFTDKISNNDQVLNYSNKATKAVDKLTKTTVATKIAKIKAFYDARVRSIYSSLQNSQKVVFSSLKEYGREPDNIQLTEGDFTPVATKIVDTQVKDYSSDPNKLPKVVNLFLLIIFVPIAFVVFVISGEFITDLMDEILP